MIYALAEAEKNIKNAVELYNNKGCWNMIKHKFEKIGTIDSKTKSDSLKEIQNVCEQCRACDLHKTRNNVVFSDGSPEAEIMLIGEAPGADEDATGTPFVGRAGKLLNEFLKNAGLSRDQDLYICNTIKCRPPQNRVPEKSEKSACAVYLNAQISLVKPKIILLCGATAASSFIEEDFKITQIRGKWLDIFDGIDSMVILHPSYLLRNHSIEEGSPRWHTMRDLENVKNKLVSLRSL